jgi:hypothetical protein
MSAKKAKANAPPHSRGERSKAADRPFMFTTE